MADTRLRIATCSLAGCFGCHMSLLDIDERLFDLLEHVEFDRSPFTDVKEVGPCDVGFVEGGVCNAENMHVLRAFRRNCTTLIAVGSCAITGGVPAMRNNVDLWGCFQEVYRYEAGTEGRLIPNDPELPLPFDKVRPVYELVRVDHFLPGCPPSADAIWTLLTALLQGRVPQPERRLLRYD
jgi:NAD-reducing hydrogenase small subunit